MVLETWVQSQIVSYQKLKKMVLDTSLLNTQQYKVRIKGKVVLYTSLLNTQHYKVHIKGKVEQSRERSSASPTPRCISLLVALDYGRQLTYYIYIYIYISFICVWSLSSSLSLSLSIYIERDRDRDKQNGRGIKTERDKTIKSNKRNNK